MNYLPLSHHRIGPQFALRKQNTTSRPVIGESGRRIIEDRNVLFYSASLKEIGGSLLQILASHVPKGKIEICRSIDALEDRLRSPLEGLTVAVFRIADADELEALIALRELLGDFKIVLALPDNQGETTARGHLLRPRFCVYSETDLPAASSILRKMTQVTKSAAA